MMQIPPHVRRFRERHRRTIGARYRGWAHLAFTSAGSLAAMAAALWGLHDMAPAEWLALPGTFLLANLIEYLGHRGPMHHPSKRLRLLYKRHARQHHRFYTCEAMACESPRDFQMILFPPAMLVLFLGVVAVPLGLLLYWLTTANVGRLFAATAMAYFLTYEWLHFCYHQDPDSWLGRLPLIHRLRHHHRVHHDLALMSRWNFNITFPLCDRLFGTCHRPGATPGAPGTTPGAHVRAPHKGCIKARRL